MNNRLFVFLIAVCLAIATAGCASSKTKKHRKPTSRKHREEVVLPRQTGSNLDRRIIVDDQSSGKKTKKKQRDSKPQAKKDVKTESTESKRAEPKKPTEPERAESKKPEEPEETPPPSDRFR
jgi:hypothetical protein